MRRAASLRAAAAAYRWGSGRGFGYVAGTEPGQGPTYRQGQSPAPRRREYFYWVDTHGRLFLDDAKVKNFITCFKDERFLAFFFHHLQPNRSGRYEDSFPFLSPCGPERNFVRCQDLPIVFTRVLEGERTQGALLSYCGGGSRLVVPFQPQCLTFWPENGRLYHPGPEGGGGMGLVRSALVEEWGDGFEYGVGGGEAPTHFVWGGRRYQLGHPLLGRLRRRGGDPVAPKTHGIGVGGTAEGPLHP